METEQKQTPTATALKEQQGCKLRGREGVNTLWTASNGPSLRRLDSEREPAMQRKGRKLLQVKATACAKANSRKRPAYVRD